MSTQRYDDTGVPLVPATLADPAMPSQKAAVDAHGDLHVGGGTVAMKSLDAVTAPGTGVAFNLQTARKDWAVQVRYTGSPVSCVVDFEVCLNDVKWVKVGSWDNGVVAANGDTIWFTGKPATNVRLRLITLTGGTNPTVDGWIAGC